jgi:hypothetical protein
MPNFRGQRMTDIPFKADQKAKFENLHVEWEIARRKRIVWKTSSVPTATARVDEGFVDFLKECRFPFEIM